MLETDWRFADQWILACEQAEVGGTEMAQQQHRHRTFPGAQGDIRLVKIQENNINTQNVLDIPLSWQNNLTEWMKSYFSHAAGD